MLLLLALKLAGAQVSLDQYYYFGADQTLMWAPIARYQSPGDWHAEMRYNYEDNRTLSLYAGKTFAREGSRLSYSITPLIGGVVGKFKGGSMGLNLTLNYNNLFFESQSQYSFDLNGESMDFLYAWSEVGYQMRPWLFGGVSAQNTYLCQDESRLFNPGIFLGVELGAWSFPLYSFASADGDPYFVLGINFKPRE
jgi:hypothetical protein